MHKMQTVVTDVRVSVSPFVCRVQCVRSFGAAFTKLLWPLVLCSTQK